jgi:pesticin/yersiniabactin receptor
MIRNKVPIASVAAPIALAAAGRPGYMPGEIRAPKEYPMSRFGLARTTSITAILLAAWSAAAPAQESNPDAASGSAQPAAPVTLQPLEVTANKRSQDLRDVDGTVSVRTAEELEEAHVTQVQDLEKVFPGLVIRNRGNRAYASSSVRGITSPDFYNPAIQVYVDGVPQDASYFTQELVDVERVELLRGPQGTLYGRNAHGGVLNIVTKQPGNDYHARLGGTVANREYDSDLNLSGPIAQDLLFADVDLHWGKELGRNDDVATGNDDFDHSNTLVGRAKLRLAPKDSPLDLALSYQHDRLKSHEEVYQTGEQHDDHDYNSLLQGYPEYKRTVDTVALNGSYDFGPVQLSSISSYQDRDLSPRWVSGFDTPEFQDSFAQELRLNFEISESWSGIVGGYFQRTDFHRNTPAAFGGFLGASRNEVDTQSYAAFGELTWNITKTVDLTAGLRWSREEADIHYDREPGLPLEFRAKDSFEDVSPKLSAGWEFLPEQRLYAVASRGFKPGGFNHALGFTVTTTDDAIAYDSETSSNFELGWRGALLDGMLEANVAGYYILTEDKQIYVGTLPNMVLRNAGDAESYGIEASARVMPDDAWTFDFGATIGRSEFTDARDPITGASLKGNRVPYAPDQVYQAAVSYLLPVQVIEGDISFRVAGSYVSRTYFDEANAFSQDGYGLLDASIDLRLEPGIKLSLFADNLTDVQYKTYSFASGADVLSNYSEGRVFGLSGSIGF